MKSYFDIYGKPALDEQQRAWYDLIYRKRWKSLRGVRILDVGFGAGHLLRTAPPGTQVIGIDLDPAAALYFGRNCLVASGTCQPFADQTFDAVHCAHVIEHLSSPDELVREFDRVLKPGGLLMVLTPDIERKGFKFWVDYTHKTPFTRKSLTALLTRHKFRVISMEYGLFHDTRYDAFLRRRFPSTMEFWYDVKKRLGQRFDSELIVVAEKDATGIAARPGALLEASNR